MSKKSVSDVILASNGNEFEDKAGQDRSQRFEYLLKQAEIFTHFMIKNKAKIATPKLTRKKRKLPIKQNGNKRKKKDANDNESSYSSHTEDILACDAPESSQNDLQDCSQDDKLNPFETSPNYIKNGQMRRYQIIGLNWMISLFEQGINGILADEMGLGKSLQTVAFLGYLKHFRKIRGYHLIIVPLATLANWMNEFQKWCPSLCTVQLTGSKVVRKKIIREELMRGKWEVCVTTYEICRIEINSLKRFNWSYVVIDEAHRIKNEKTLLSRVVREFTCTNRLLLTGTPMQNNLHELWSLLNFLLPDVFNSAEDFDDWFNTRQCLSNAALVERLQAILKPFLLRRLKILVEPDLKPKKIVNIFVGLSKMQREWYKKVLKGFIDIKNNQGKEVQHKLLNIWMQLRKVANHPYLFKGAEVGPPYTTDMHLVFNSGKMVILDKILAKMKAEGSRVLIFSQMKCVLDIIEDYCMWREYEYCRLDGSSSANARQNSINEFNAEKSPKFIFMMTTRAGGLGINLPTADVVIIFDIDSNPQADLQAEDRAHRIGQKKLVRVFRLITENSIEEQIFERCQEKLQLDQMVIQRDAHHVNFSRETMLQIIRANAEGILASDDLELTDDYYNDIIERISI